MAKTDSSMYSIRSVERAMEVLIALGKESPLGVTELANKLNLHKSTVHRLVATLESRSFVEKEPNKGGYRLGLRLLELGGSVSSRLELCQEAKPYLKNLSRRTGYTAHLVVLSGYDPIYIEKVENPNGYVKYSQIGKRLPINATAAGKVLLAYLTEREVDDILNESLVAYTKNTIIDAKVLREHLREIKTVEYALDMEELEIGLCCIAAPVRDNSGNVVAAVSLSGVGAAMKQDGFPVLISYVKEVVQEISFRLGHGINFMV
ncbi:MAG: IclR family transcriptional regulator [Bacillota bacterium]